MWRILDSRERDLTVEPIAGLAFAVCPDCGSLSEINGPLLLIRPGHELPWLLALPMQEMSHPLPRIRELALEASELLGAGLARQASPSR